MNVLVLTKGSTHSENSLQQQYHYLFIYEKQNK